MAFVYYGAKVAPSHRVATSLALGATIIGIATFALGLFAQSLLRAVDFGYWRLGLYAVFYLGLYVAGVIYGVRLIQKNVASEERMAMLVEANWPTSAST